MSAVCIWGDDLATLHALVPAHPLATLITSGVGGLLANLVPFTFAGGGENGIFRAHVAKANDQVEALRRLMRHFIHRTQPKICGFRGM